MKVSKQAFDRVLANLLKAPPMPLKAIERKRPKRQVADQKKQPSRDQQ